MVLEPVTHTSAILDKGKNKGKASIVKQEVSRTTRQLAFQKEWSAVADFRFFSCHFKVNLYFGHAVLKAFSPLPYDSTGCLSSQSPSTKQKMGSDSFNPRTWKYQYSSSHPVTKWREMQRADEYVQLRRATIKTELTNLQIPSLPHHCWHFLPDFFRVPGL